MLTKQIFPHNYKFVKSQSWTIAEVINLKNEMRQMGVKISVGQCSLFSGTYFILFSSFFLCQYTELDIIVIKKKKYNFLFKLNSCFKILVVKKKSVKNWKGGARGRGCIKD